MRKEHKKRTGLTPFVPEAPVREDFFKKNIFSSAKRKAITASHRNCIRQK
jgi:hypothetical protein